MNLPDGVKLNQLLPHSDTMLLVTDVLQVDSQQSLSLFEVKESWPSATSGGVASHLLIEVAAQAAGLCCSMQRLAEEGLDSDPSGWLVGIKTAQFHQAMLPLGTMIKAQAELLFSYDNLKEVGCQLSVEDQPVAEMKLQLFKQ